MSNDKFSDATTGVGAVAEREQVPPGSSPADRTDSVPAGTDRVAAG